MSHKPILERDDDTGAWSWWCSCSSVVCRPRTEEEARTEIRAHLKKVRGELQPSDGEVPG